MTVTFFGHRDTPHRIQPILQNVLSDLIENQNADNFYVGNHGNFDRMVLWTLKQLKEKYPHIEYTVVLAYRPRGRDVDDEQTLYPFALHGTPYAYAIPARNRWMVMQSDTVITYVITVGGAEKSQRLARSKGKRIINLADIEKTDEK